MSAEVVGLLREGVIATTLAMLAVLLLRKPLRQACGAGCIPLLWVVVPLVQVAMLLPAPAQSQATTWMMLPMVTTPAMPMDPVAAVEQGWNWAPWILSVWLAGSLAMASRFLFLQISFLRRLGTLTPHAPGVFLASNQNIGPAVLGILRPRIVLPTDFRQRYTHEQQALILAHEHSHARRGDVGAQAIASLLQCLYWFNPLVHFAANRLRHDQELAADADVARHHPGSRRCYAATLLDTQLATPGLPVGCLWHSTHPLKERILMLKNTQPSRWRQRTGSTLVTLLMLTSSLAAWANQAGHTHSGGSSSALEHDSAARYLVKMEVTLDHLVSRPELVVRSNAPMVIEMGDAGMATGWRGEFIYDGDAGSITHADITVNGMPAGPVDLAALNIGRVVEVSTTDGGPTMLLSVAVSPAGNSEARPMKGNVPPRYPITALRDRQSGLVMLAVKVDKRGNPEELHVESASPEGIFEEAAKAAVKQWRFIPALENGEPTESWRQVPVCFRIEDAQVEGCEAES